MRAESSNRFVPVYPALLWQVLKIIAALLALAGSALAGEAGGAGPGTLRISDANGAEVEPFAGAKERKATLLVFIGHDCPIANGYAPEIQRIATEYGVRGVGVYLVHTDADLSATEAKKHAAEFGYTPPVLLDGGLRLARHCGATVTPEAALFGSDGVLKYLGRIDDRHVDFGKKRVEPTRRDLRKALDEVLAGKAVSVPRAPAVGCFIPETTGTQK